MRNLIVPVGAFLVTLLSGCSSGAAIAGASISGALCPPAEALSLGVEGPNLIYNGDCENGTPLFGSGGPTTGTWALSGTKFHSGAKSLSSTGSTAGVRGFYLNTGSPSVFKVGSSYVFRGWAYIPSGSTSLIGLVSITTQGANGSNGVFSSSAYFSSFDSWQPFEIRFSVPYTISVAYLTLGVQSQNANTFIYFDDFEFREVTEPSPAPSPTPTPVPSPGASSSPFDPGSSPAPSSGPGLLGGLEHTQAEALALAVDPMLNQGLLVLSLITVFRLGWKAVRTWI